VPLAAPTARRSSAAYGLRLSVRRAPASRARKEHVDAVARGCSFWRRDELQVTPATNRPAFSWFRQAAARADRRYGPFVMNTREIEQTSRISGGTFVRYMGRGRVLASERQGNAGEGHRLIADDLKFFSRSNRPTEAGASSPDRRLRRRGVAVASKEHPSWSCSISRCRRWTAPPPAQRCARSGPALTRSSS